MNRTWPLACVLLFGCSTSTDSENGSGATSDAQISLDASGARDAETPPDGGQPPGPVVVESVVGGLTRPWAIDFVASGAAFVTERGGQLRRLDPDGTLSAPFSGVPEVYASGQGGLLDVLASEAFATDRTLFLCYAAEDQTGSGTEVVRARVDGSQLVDVAVIFRVDPKIRRGSNHYGCRMAFDGDGHLFLGVGDRFNELDQAQVLSNHLGKVIRIEPDGQIPSDNPFVGQANARDEIWSYGHRNIQGMATHPATGEVWTHEHGPAGGDEVNRPQAGRNYGWPNVCYGSHYDGRPIPDQHAPNYEEPIHYWTPSIAPSGMTFYTGAMFPEWEGDLFVGALAGQHLARLDMENGQVVGEEQMLANLGQRVRDVTVAPDGAIYVVVDSDSGEIIRIRR